MGREVTFACSVVFRFLEKSINYVKKRSQKFLVM